MPKEISKWPRRKGLSARKGQRPMSIDLGLVPLTPQTGHCARAASQALLKELLGKGLARRGVSGCVASAGQALWGLTCLRALPVTPRRCHHFGNLFRHLLYYIYMTEFDEHQSEIVAAVQDFQKAGDCPPIVMPSDASKIFSVPDLRALSFELRDPDSLTTFAAIHNAS
jgi:hypothetical protein